MSNVDQVPMLADIEPALEQAREFIARRRWKFAKTMAHIPHWYTVREWEPDGADFDRMIQTIRAYGYQNRFGRTTYTYLDLDGWSYWTMGAPVDETIIINRARPKHYHSALKGSPVIWQARQYDPVFIPPQRPENAPSVAFCHDVRLPLPPSLIDGCDVVYTEPAWQHGVKVFNGRIGSGAEYGDVMEGLANIVSGLDIPVAMTGGRAMLRYLPAPDAAIPITLNGNGAELYCWRMEPPIRDSADAEQAIAALAQRYRRVLDVTCGYGRAGRIFRAHGGEFVMSDYDPTCIGYVAMNARGWRRAAQ